MIARNSGKSFGSGKGAAAAIYGALISGLLRILAPKRSTPAELMQALNEALLERKVDAQYATLSLLLWNSVKRTFTIAAAGTLPPLVLRDGGILDFAITGVPIGLLDDRTYEQVECAAQPGDVVVLYSDGVEDQLSASGGDYGRERLQKVLLANSAEKPSVLIARVFEDIDKFRGSVVLTDDQSIVAMRVL